MIDKNDNNTHICQDHKQPYIRICLNLQCNQFKTLCSECLKNHNHNNQLTGGLDPQMLDYNVTKQSFIDKLNNAKQEISSMIEQLNEILTLNNEKIVQEVFTQLEDVQQKVIKVFAEIKGEIMQAYKQKVKKINEEIVQFIDDLHYSYDLVQKYSNPLTSKSMKLVNNIDLDYQLNYKNTKVTQMRNQKEKMRFDVNIIDDFQLKLFDNLRENLNLLLMYENQDSNNIESLYGSKAQQSDVVLGRSFTVSDFNNKQIKQSLQKNWAFYFKPKSKTLYYADLTQQKIKMEQIELKIEQEILQGHQTILANDGEIYYMGGFSDSMNNQNEEKFLEINRYVHTEKKFEPVGKMLTLRHDFGVAASRDQIYIIGGINYKEGILIKCEKFNIEKKTSQPINFLNQQSCCHSVCNFRDMYIFKFGGLKDILQKQYGFRSCSNMIERYSIEQDIWEKIGIKRDETNLLTNQWHSQSALINQNNILIFGGYDDYQNPQKQCYLMYVRQNAMGFSFSNYDEYQSSICEINKKQLPQDLIFYNNPIICNNKLYQIGFNPQQITVPKLFVFDSKNWKVL